MAVVDVVKWLISDQVGQAPRVEIDDFIELRRHRVLTRLIDAMLRDPGNFASLSYEVQKRATEESYHYSLRNIDFLKTVSWLSASGLGVSTERPIVVLKGPSAWINMGGSHRIRRTSDIDVLVSDPEALASSVADLGIEVRHNVLPHEVVDFTVEVAGSSWDVDVHRSFPVWRYLEAGGKTRIACTPLLYDVIVEHSEVFPGGTGNLRHTNVTMTAFISMCHMFHDYVEQPLCGAKPLVRAHEVIEIYELALHPLFDPDAFVRLVREHQAHDCLDLLRNVLSSVGGTDALRAIDDQSSSSENRKEFPRDIAWNVLTPGIYSDYFGANVGLDRMDLQPVVVDVMNVGLAWNADSPARVGESHDAYRVDAEVEPDAITFTVTFLSLTGYLDEFRVIFDDGHIQVGLNHYFGFERNMFLADACRVEWRVDQEVGTSTVLVSVPRSMVRAYIRSDGAGPVLSCVIACTRFLRPPGAHWDAFFESGSTTAALRADVVLPSWSQEYESPSGTALIRATG